MHGKAGLGAEMFCMLHLRDPVSKTLLKIPENPQVGHLGPGPHICGSFGYSETTTLMSIYNAGAEEDEGPGEAWCAQRGLLDRGTCADVAKHCNDRKIAAKSVQARATLALRRPLRRALCFAVSRAVPLQLQLHARTRMP